MGERRGSVWAEGVVVVITFHKSVSKYCGTLEGEGKKTSLWVCVMCVLTDSSSSICMLIAQYL